MLEARELLAGTAGSKELGRRRMIVEIMVKPDRQSRLARRLGVSQATVSTLIKELAESGIVEGDSARPSSGGVRLRPTRGVAVGIDLGFNHVTVIARRVDEPYDRLVSRTSDNGANRGLDRLLPEIQQMVSDAVAETGQHLDGIVSAGVAVPRMINPRDERFTTPILPPWTSDDQPARALSKLLKVQHVAIDNDANLGAMAEQTYGLEDPVETVVYIKASTGIGAGITIGSTLVRGLRGMAGEIGHLTLRRDGDACMCGGRGCLDTIAGAEALLAQVRQAYRGNAFDTPTTLKSLVEKALAGDAVCVRVLNDAGRALGFALAQLCNLINPNLIVLGGELANGKHLVIDTCGQQLRRYALSGAVGELDGFVLRTTALGQLAEAHGALILGLRSRQLDASGNGE